MAATFGRNGWEVDRLVYMVRRRDADRESDVRVEECTLEEVYPLLLETNLHHGGITRPAAEADVAVRRAFVDLTGARFFVGRIDGALAGFCELYVHEGVAEIDAVHMLERFRRRGIARGVVGHAARHGRDAGADLVFLIAVDADWPRELYVKLGFDPVGRVLAVHEAPPGESLR